MSPQDTEVEFVEVEPGIRVAAAITGKSQGIPVLLENSLATNWGIWDEVYPLISPHLQIIRYDRRGHGRSDAPPSGYTLPRFGGDALAVLSHFGVDRAVICGVSLGGMVAMWLGINRPERVAGLALINTAAVMPPPALWGDRAILARQAGVAQFADPTLGRWFTKAFTEVHLQRLEQLRNMIAATDPEAYAGCCELMVALNLVPDLPKISCPTTVVVGEQDPSTPPERGRDMAAKIPKAKLLSLDVAHMGAVEQPAAVAAVILNLAKEVAGQ